MQIRSDFPQLTAGALCVDGIHADCDVSEYVESLHERARQRLQQSEEGQMPEIEAWRRTYAQMGLKPTKYRCAAESLLRRFKKEDTLPQLHPVVDFCNALSMAYALPIAVCDADQLCEYVEVRYANGDEHYLEFGGEVEHPEPGEVVFADGDNAAHSRRWCYRQSKQSVVSPSTTKALFVSEAMHEQGNNDLSSLFSELEEFLSEAFGLESTHSLLADNQPQFSW